MILTMWETARGLMHFLRQSLHSLWNSILGTSPNSTTERSNRGVGPQVPVARRDSVVERHVMKIIPVYWDPSRSRFIEDTDITQLEMVAPVLVARVKKE
jgi:hypothetical protein